MKRTLSILMIFLIVFNAGGYFFIYNQLENYFKEKATTKISDYIPLEKLEKIRYVKNQQLDNTLFERLNDKEIRYEGNMFDIYYEEVSGDTITFYCINDKYEDILQEAFSEYLNGQEDNGNNTAISNLIKIFVVLGLEPLNNRQVNLPFKNDISFLIQTLVIDTKLDIPVPPPRITT